MYGDFKNHLQAELDAIREAGFYKSERVITTPQGSHVGVPSGDVINLCANNYLGLAQDERVKRAASEGLERWGYGMASVRFICGTQEPHKELERRLSEFLGTDDTILYSSCFDANGGLFETLLGAQDAIISDELNHASIIDGVRLSKARRFRYRNRDMDDLERQLKDAADARYRLVATDGVFSMDGYVAKLDEITPDRGQFPHASGLLDPRALLKEELSLFVDSILRSDRLTCNWCSGSTPRRNGEYHPISPACAGIGKTPHSYAARTSSSLKSRETPIRSSWRHSAGDPNGDSIKALSAQGRARVLPGSH